MLKIYNTLTRGKKEFIPQSPPQVTMYTCGVTVYDDCHIGHARSLYIFDVMRRYLKYRGFDVKFVRNITDIDDKIINRANELKTDWQELVKKYIERYYEDLKALGIEKADYEPRATENIPDMIKYITALIDKGYAYAVGGDVYFSVRKFPEYGKLSGQKINEMEKGVRIEPTEYKKDHLDFALWKASKEGEPFWESLWGKGRPGWHIECSVMSQKFLKTDTLDIHAGGRDLVFPHHENELAQAEGYTGKIFAKYWIHHGLLTINGQKMAKSLGNFVTIKDFITKYKDPDILKLFFLSAHYAHPIDYSEKKIEETKEALCKLKSFLSEKFMLWLYDFAEQTKRRYPDFGKLALHAESTKFREKIDSYKTRLFQAMDDDFNVTAALAVLFEARNFIWDHRNPLKVEIEDLQYAKNLVSDFIDFTHAIFGLSLRKEESLDDKLKIRERNEARKNGDFIKADKLRKELEERGYMVIDSKDGNSEYI